MPTVIRNPETPDWYKDLPNWGKAPIDFFFGNPEDPNSNVTNLFNPTITGPTSGLISLMSGELARSRAGKFAAQTLRELPLEEAKATVSKVINRFPRAIGHLRNIYKGNAGKDNTGLFSPNYGAIPPEPVRDALEDIATSNLPKTHIKALLGESIKPEHMGDKFSTSTKFEGSRAMHPVNKITTGAVTISDKEPGTLAHELGHSVAVLGKNSPLKAPRNPKYYTEQIEKTIKIFNDTFHTNYTFDDYAAGNIPTSVSAIIHDAIPNEALATGVEKYAMQKATPNQPDLPINSLSLAKLEARRRGQKWSRFNNKDISLSNYLKGRYPKFSNVPTTTPKQLNLPDTNEFGVILTPRFSRAERDWYERVVRPQQQKLATQYFNNDNWEPYSSDALAGLMKKQNNWATMLDIAGLTPKR